MHLRRSTPTPRRRTSRSRSRCGAHGRRRLSCEDFDKIFASFEEAYPWITVKSVGNVDDTKMLAAINSGTPPDAALSFSFDNVGQVLSERGVAGPHAVHGGDRLRRESVPGVGHRVHELRWQHLRAAVPDRRVRALLQHRHVREGRHHRAAEDHVASSSRRRRSSRCSTTTDRSRSPGSCRTWRTTRPTSSRSPRCSAPSGTTTTGRSSAVNSDPAWQDMANWQKELVDFYGYDNLQRFVAGQGDEWGEEQDFQTGRVAMTIDGEWRTSENFMGDPPAVPYMTAPFPVPDDQRRHVRHGSGRRHDHRHPEGLAAPRRRVAARLVDGHGHGHPGLHGQHRSQRADDIRRALVAGAGHHAAVPDVPGHPSPTRTPTTRRPQRSARPTRT